MKLLHLSDLHTGKTVNGFSMMEEQKHAFEQIIHCVKTEAPDAVVIAGDVYDRAVPGVEAVRLFDDFLTALSQESAAVMVISGNHDSPERLDFASRLLYGRRLFIYGAFDGAMRKVTLNDAYGEVHFWLLPFVKPASVCGFFGDSQTDTYDEALRLILERADLDYAKRNVLVSHQFYTKTGLNPERSESELSPVGGLDAVNVSLIEKFDYAALGHLHGSQGIGLEHIRYSGSPVKYSFSEWRQEKSVKIVEMKEKGTIHIKRIPLTPLHDMRELKGEMEKLMREEIVSLADREDYLRVILTDEEEIIDPMGRLRGVYPNIMSLGFENSRTDIHIGLDRPDTDAIEKLSLYDLFHEFFLETQGSAMNGEQAAIVRGLLEGGDGE